jgi:CubicO group peptidase (beta-lactamase class C family)
MEARAPHFSQHLPEPCRGYVAPRLAPVAEAFAENFRARGEMGAALCVYHRGEKVVDLWGGVRDTRSGAPWEEDTMVCGFSTTKGAAAAACAVAVSRGLFAYDDPVALHWPEFAAAGKADVTVRELLGHQAGVSHLSVRLGLRQLRRRERLSQILAAQKPVLPPRRWWGYHAMTWGFYVDELMRRTDPLERSVGGFFDNKIATPLDLAFHIGLPETVRASRLARIELPGRTQVIRGIGRLPRAMVPKVLNPFSRLQRSLRVLKGFHVNSRPWLTVEIASANGVGEVRALARLYGSLATGGNELNIKGAVMDELTAPADIPPGGSRDMVMGVDARWRLGFAKPSPAFPFGSGPRAFGMPGIGGSFAFADPDLELGYAYVPMRLGIVPFDEPRETALRDALYQCLR